MVGVCEKVCFSHRQENAKLVFARYILQIHFGAGQSAHLLVQIFATVTKTLRVCAVAVEELIAYRIFHLMAEAVSAISSGFHSTTGFCV